MPITVTPQDEEAFNQASKFDPKVKFVDINPIPQQKSGVDDLNPKTTEDNINFDPNSGEFFKSKRNSK